MVLTPTDYDKSEVNFRKHHTIIGGGQGQDLIIQDGKYFTATGRRINGPINRSNLEKNGIPWSRDIQNALKVSELRQQAEKQRAALEEQIRELERKERERVMLGLASPTFEDRSEVPDPAEEPTAEEQVEQLDLSGLEELEEMAGKPEDDDDGLDLQLDGPPPDPQPTPSKPTQIKKTAKPKAKAGK